LIKKDWIGNTKCVFCDDEESTSHLFVTCPLVKQIWQWIAKYNKFLFEGNTLSDLWLMNRCIPFKNKFVTELLRGVVLWTIWLERNKLVLTDKKNF
jgi:zinc-binding in reverse transcriptase